MPDRIEARYTRSFVTRRSVFFAGMTAVGAGLFVWGTLAELAPVRIAGTLTIAAFLPGFFYARLRLTSPHPVIVVGPAGFFDGRFGAPIPWAAITDLRRRGQGTRLVLMIDVAEPGRYLERAGPAAFFLRWLNPALGRPVLGSNLAGLDMPPERIAAAAEAWWKAEGRG